MKKIIKKIILVIFIIISVYNMIYLIINLIKYDMNFFGLRFFILESNSMKPAIGQKDVVIFKEIKKSEVNQDDIILYINGKNIRVGRVLKTNQNMGKVSYVVKADNRDFNDTSQLLEENIQGKMVGKLTNVAMFFKILHSKILTVFVIIVLFIMYKLKQYKKRIRKRRKKQNKKLKQI